MDLSLDAPIFCNDGLAGYLTGFILFPDRSEIESIVMQPIDRTRVEVIIPSADIVRSTFRFSEIGDSSDQVSNREPFHQTHYVSLDMPLFGSLREFFIWGNMSHHSLTRQYIRVRHTHLPVNLLTNSIGASVYTREGLVGTVHEFLVARKHGHLAYLVCQTGHC